MASYIVVSSVLTCLYIVFFLITTPKSDTCKSCDTMKVKIKAESYQAKKTQLNADWKLYKIRAQNSYQQLNENAALAKK